MQALTNTHEQLLLAWWNFIWTCTYTIFKTLWI